MKAAECLVLPDCAERLAVALDAAWEIEALAVLLRHSKSDDEFTERLVVRGLTMRVKDLAGIVMDALDHAAEPLALTRGRLTGLHAEAERGIA